MFSFIIAVSQLRTTQTGVELDIEETLSMTDSEICIKVTYVLILQANCTKYNLLSYWSPHSC